MEDDREKKLRLAACHHHHHHHHFITALQGCGRGLATRKLSVRPSVRPSICQSNAWSEIADFRSIFARSASAVTPSETSLINTNRKSTARFPMSPR